MEKAAPTSGQGKVFICKDQYLDRLVAIKFLKTASIRASKKEVSAIREIQSKHVVQILDLVNSSTDGLGLVAEYLPGPDLAPCLSPKKTVVLDSFLKVLYQIACGIADIHACGCIHRDIKPQNVRFDQEHIIKIFDFGLSSLAKNEEETVAGRGTRVFRAPELYSGKAVAVDMPIDVYAFGITAWWLTDKIPSVLWDIPPQQNGAPPSIKTVVLDIMDDLAEVLDMTLRVNPAERPKMVEVRDVLKKHLLYGKHRARFTARYQLDTPNKILKINPAYGKIEVRYTGFDFIIHAASGEVSINKLPAVAGEVLPDSCVIMFGNDSRGADRVFIPFEMSHPEVVL